MTRPAFRTLADLRRDADALFLGYRAELKERHAARDAEASTDPRTADKVLAHLSAAIDRAAEVRL